MRRFLLFCLALPGTALAGPALDIGLRLERLTIEEPLDFSCDEPCDVVDDPSCVALPEDQLCHDRSVDEPHDGWGFGGYIGASTGGRLFSAGVRLAGTIGFYSPSGVGEKSDGAEPSDRDISLGHVSLEIPFELKFGGRGAQAYVQAIPRVGLLNLLQGEEEEADTFTAGVMFVLGFRVGSVGVDAGPVLHPSFNGWMAEAAWHVDTDDDEPDPEPVREKPKPKKKPVTKKPIKKGVRPKPR